MSDKSDRADRVRLDKWLWAARFYKTRGLAAEEIGKGRVSINGVAVKASREPKVSDLVAFKQGVITRTVQVLQLCGVRGPAAQAQLMFEETADSLALRARLAEQRRMGTEPAQTLEQGRPTKRNRRQLADWQRWSASADSLDPD